MKRFLTVSALAIVLLVCSSVFAQKNVTKFLGIPVDGTKSAMIQKLKAKGFTYDAKQDWLEGEFNGEDVIVGILTDNNKVWRIVVMDENTRDEGQIKIRFNKLCRQFESNKKYIPAILEEQTLSDDEDISYQISVKHKQYQASFRQLSGTVEEELQKTDTLEFQSYYNNFVERNFTEEQLSDMTEETSNNLEGVIFVSYLQDKYANSSVWLMINESSYKKYRINIY